MKRLIIGMSGASGLIYGIRMLEVLKTAPGIETHLVLTGAARLNISLETDWQADAVMAMADEVHSVKDLAASIASGSFRTDGMIVAPCSMKTLSAIVHSYADNLLTRAADVVLKERRRLVLMPRETPLHVGHCELLLKACQLGAIVAPPMPALYTKPQTVDDIINHSVGRVLDLFDVDSGLVKRWQGAAAGAS
ncbi:UbiX family flavin prenyltransferase [Pseudohongiella sp.]|uniref:flavin prenyltransferase n=1 Tax=marine sediment metagenome TaxID=412755 RepID=A0A0F9W4T4_9ZZZZ|nr:UbiX family flavin prenyltransferase [Pseudohongiella sp.]HDZ09407.1 UbiX family flavin prenyltransferase [Pseudohongiella sp.]HEA63338.1 UbiX family flavin prenyltransferase [Pseudohongiella sp.]